MAVATAALAGLLLAGAARADGFYAPPPDPGAALPAEGLYPRGRRMAYMGYSGDPARDLAAGFTAAGPVYTDEPAYLERALREGWPVVAHVGQRGAVGDPAEAAARAGERVRALASHPEIVWWAVLPEELRPWNRAEMRYLAAVSSAIRANDPSGRPVYLYNPNHWGRLRLAGVAPYVDALAKGAYANHMGRKRDRAWVGRGVREQTAALRAAGRPGAFAVVMPQLSSDPEPAEDAEIRAWVRHDVYLGLVAGAKAVLVWSLFKRPQVARTWKLWYDAYAECARELAGGLGEVFLFGEPRADLAVRWEGGADADHAVAERAHGASRWLFAVNSSNEPSAFTVTGAPPGSRVSDAFGGAALATRPGEPLRVALPAYGTAALRFEASPP